jgi:hypothetical protein
MRCKKRLGHGQNCRRVTVEESTLVAPNAAADLDLEPHDEAPSRLEAVDPLAAQPVKLLFFAGLTMPAAVAALAVPLRMAKRNWTYARTWPRRALSGETGPIRDFSVAAGVPDRPIRLSWS